MIRVGQGLNIVGPRVISQERMAVVSALGFATIVGSGASMVIVVGVLSAL